MNNVEAIVTSKDGIQFRVLLHARTDAQLNAAIRAEQKFVGDLTADQLTAFNGDFVRITSLDDVPQDPPRESVYATLTPAPNAPVRGKPQLQLIQGGLSTVFTDVKSVL
jgi:hypothetical protein